MNTNYPESYVRPIGSLSSIDQNTPIHSLYLNPNQVSPIHDLVQFYESYVRFIGSISSIDQNAPLNRSRHELLSNVSKVSTVEGETFTCTICLETSEDMSKEWSKLDKCNHIFHTSCLQEWCQINKSCPNCRHKLL
jgi:hypothetical protein